MSITDRSPVMIHCPNVSKCVGCTQTQDINPFENSVFTDTCQLDPSLLDPQKLDECKEHVHKRKQYSKQCLKQKIIFQTHSLAARDVEISWLFQQIPGGNPSWLRHPQAEKPETVGQGTGLSWVGVGWSQIWKLGFWIKFGDFDQVLWDFDWEILLGFWSIWIFGLWESTFNKKRWVAQVQAKGGPTVTDSMEIPPCRSILPTQQKISSACFRSRAMRECCRFCQFGSFN